YQGSTTSMSASWSGFGDPESGIAGYEWAIGTTAGGTDVLAFTSVGTATTATSSSLTLTAGTTYYITVRATNGSGLTCTASSDGVVAGDTDGDGIPDIVEVGDPSNPTDSDGDGIPDYLEAGDDANSASTLSIKITSRRGQELGLPKLGAKTVDLSTDRGTLVAGIKPVGNEDDYGDLPDYRFPYGVYDFQVLVDVGGTANVTVTLPAGTSLDASARYFKFTQAVGWQEYSNVSGLDDWDNVFVVTLTDGGAGDADLVANGRIVDPGGVGIPDVSSGGSGGDSGSGGCFVRTAGGALGLLALVLLALGLGAMMLRASRGRCA
ncbi:MAG: fibronectin type III domain-containing protein, partial [Candidatus Bipolaricaulota bacterium]